MLVFVGCPSWAGGRYPHDMGEAALDLELVVSADRDLTVPAGELRRLAAVPGQRVRVRIEPAGARPAQVQLVRPLMGAFARAGTARLELDDFGQLSDDFWRDTGYGHA